MQNRCNDMEHLHCLSIVNITYSHFKAKSCASRDIHMTLGSDLSRCRGARRVGRSQGTWGCPRLERAAGLVRSLEKHRTPSCEQVNASGLPSEHEGAPIPSCSVTRLAAIGEGTRCWVSLSRQDTILSRTSLTCQQHSGSHPVTRGRKISPQLGRRRTGPTRGGLVGTHFALLQSAQIEWSLGLSGSSPHAWRTSPNASKPYAEPVSNR